MSVNEAQQRVQQLVSFNLAQVNHKLFRHTNRELAKLPMPVLMEQLPILFMLYLYSDECKSQQEIANALQKDKSGILRSIRTLEKNNYVRVVQDAGDRRKNSVCLTDAGKAVCDIAIETAQSLDKEITDHLTPEETTSLLRILNKINIAITN
ncbi:hypothetical protein GCM10023189_28350 [Nibrella saemangeumensis]|uniref:HTH marR-type domain-containing protein n=1 Tax=Nibrella saemangeumensis TaxID=1084526 RepID=A0ABP8N0J0_9BACT